MTPGSANLASMYALADDIDRREGHDAYRHYRRVLAGIAEAYEVKLPIVLAVFAATSPNCGYVQNLRSTVTLLDAAREGRPFETVTTATYRHASRRAWAYLTEGVDFMATTSGPKIRSFYMNLIDPDDPRPVTIDGHMVAAWRGTRDTMKDSIVRPALYRTIADDVRALAGALTLIPNQVQATIWLARKRTLRVLYQPQLTMFPPDVVCRSIAEVRRALPPFVTAS